MKKIITSFETLPLNTGLQAIEGSMSYSVTQDKTIFRSGSASCRFELRASDPEVQYGNKRAEITVINNVTADKVDNTIQWYRFSTYQPSNTSQPDTRREIFPSQWHDKSSSCSTSPPFALVIENGRHKVDVRYSTANYCSTPSSKRYVRKEGVLTSDSGTLLDIGSIITDKWVDWVINYIPKTDNTGKIKIWKDGVVVFDYNGPCTYIGSQIPYQKIGIYKWPWMNAVPTGLPTIRVGYIDMLAVGDSAETYDSMKIGGTTVTPPVNIVPTVVAVDVNTDKATATLTASANDPDGTIVKYQWSQVSGPATVISNANSATANISNLVEATYVFKITVTDDKGATASDDCLINVVFPNQLPTVIIIESSPTRTVNLVASASDSDGSILSYLWNTGDTTSAISLTGTIGQVQMVSVTVTDNKGGKATANYTITF